MTGLVLDAAHRYTLDGRRVPGVTSVLNIAGLVDHQWANQWHLDRGSAIHKSLELYVRGTLDWATVDDRILGYVKSGVKFLTEAGCDLATAEPEVMVASRRHQYAGKCDLVAVLFGELCLVDYKSGALGAVGVQCAGYEIAYREERGVKKLLRRVGLKLGADGKYKMKQLTDFGDYAVWLQCVEKFHAKDEE